MIIRHLLCPKIDLQKRRRRCQQKGIAVGQIINDLPWAAAQRKRSVDWARSLLDCGNARRYVSIAVSSNDELSHRRGSKCSANAVAHNDSPRKTAACKSADGKAACARAPCVCVVRTAHHLHDRRSNGIGHCIRSISWAEWRKGKKEKNSENKHSVRHTVWICVRSIPEEHKRTQREGKKTPTSSAVLSFFSLLLFLFSGNTSLATSKFQTISASDSGQGRREEEKTKLS